MQGCLRIVRAVLIIHHLTTYLVTQEDSVKVVRSSPAVQCKCHGVSGACSVKTCWKSLPRLERLARLLLLRYRRAREVSRKSAPRRKDELVFWAKSPDYCELDPRTGSMGTVGRSVLPGGCYSLEEQTFLLLPMLPLGSTQVSMNVGYLPGT
ncbi:WNT11 [Cordylochernes scorpioides]|uniref:Protein Wnt n=1 Tax=Cordylochernes scorpioides TaxID=51811 RepID=A0ABY6KPI4_9ARAC|nr:WNT11 [Cordylochernes scorpioides]